ncbi:MAG: hypothetical protein IKP88_02160 [Lachnospiraceae bacterium]|nr:hypothetical protein [Lachnospiraceae bacterium]
MQIKDNTILKKIRTILLGTFIFATISLASGCSSKNADEQKTTPTSEISSTPEETSMPESTSVPKVSPTSEATPTPEATPTSKATPTTEPTPTMSAEELYLEAVEKSLVATGNNYRLKRVLEKARAGEDIYVCALGGSVTEGALARTNDEGYAYLFANEFKSTYCPGDGSNFHFVNAGLSGTPSCLGIIRYRQDVVDLLGADPDILIIEFAINDYNEPTKGRAYESLIRKALEANDECAVILLYSIAKTGWNMQDNYIKVGKYYDVQQVSIKNALYKTSKIMRVSESKYFADDYHPTTYGHKMMKDCMMNLIKVVDSEETETPTDLPENDMFGSDFKNLVMIDSNSLKLDHLSINPGSFSDRDEAVVNMYFTKAAAFPNNFCHKAGSENKPFKLTLNCKNILINYKTSSNTSFGKADFYIDGELVATADGYSSGGWNNCNVIMLLRQSETAEHVLEVKMAEGSEDKAFTIFSIGYSE